MINIYTKLIESLGRGSSPMASSEYIFPKVGSKANQVRGIMKEVIIN